MNTIEYYFDSASRDSGTNESPVFELDRPLSMVSWRVKQVEIPFSYYVINSSSNTLTFNDGSSRQVSVTAGNYDGATLATDLQSALNASPSALTFTVTYNPQNYKFTIAETSGPTNFTIEWTSDSGLGDILGFDTSADDSGASTYTSDNASNLSGDNFLLLKSSELSPGGSLNGEQPTNIIVTRVPVEVSAGGLIVYDGREDTRRIKRFSPDRIDFKLQHKDETAVDLNGLPWSLTLEITQ